MTKEEQLRAMREAKFAKRGLRVRRAAELRPSLDQSELEVTKTERDGVALRSMKHPPELLNKMVDAIRSGKLDATKPTKPKRGRPRSVGPRPWEAEGLSRRTWYRRQREKK